jgi:small subunit ribosomal protein S16
MAVKIRFQRHGAKNAPVFRLVATESSSPRDGRFIELLGHYNPVLDEYQLKLDRIDYRISVGGQLSDRAKSLLRQARKQTVVDGKVTFSARKQVKAEVQP